MQQQSSSWMDAIYWQYVHSKGPDSEEVKRCYEKLNRHLQNLSRQQQNHVECAVNELGAMLERVAFLDGVRIGAKLLMELEE